MNYIYYMLCYNLQGGLFGFRVLCSYNFFALSRISFLRGRLRDTCALALKCQLQIYMCVCVYKYFVCVCIKMQLLDVWNSKIEETSHDFFAGENLWFLGWSCEYRILQLK